MNSPDGSIVKTILLVEDEPSISSLCSRVLTDEGFEVAIATNGQVAQGMIKKNYYALCLIDIRTPIMGGKELYEWLLQEQPEMARRVIFTTGDIMSGDTKDFIERSNMPFLPKPFDVGQLLTVINETLKAIVK